MVWLAVIIMAVNTAFGLGFVVQEIREVQAEIAEASEEELAEMRKIKVRF